ncbi:MAG: glycoside hydrolase family 125 protein [Bacteroidota bacterium]|nr:glycoside hydrolase family 125 protein [Bacteroidota bacterium]
MLNDQQPVNQRPRPEQRKFKSEAVERVIASVKSSIKDSELAALFEHCFPNTLDTTVRFTTNNAILDTFIVTGDIAAMWLRDSTAQVWQYLPLVNEDRALKELFQGLIRHQTQCVLIDPYTNAFNDGPSDSPWTKDLTEMKPELHERKWELDSLCYVIRLAHGYWKTSGDSSCFDFTWHDAMRLIVTTMKEQQRKQGNGPYKFGRITAWSTDTVPGNGYGNPVKPVGLIASVFRPSDDATIFPFLIPSNCFAVVSLRQLAEMVEKIFQDGTFARECLNLSNEVDRAIQKFAVDDHPLFGKIYSYEVDGFGNKLWMDDANVPSLLSLPYLAYCSHDDSVYQNTRRFVLSEHNPYFFNGTAAEGIGSPHTLADRIWHIGIIMRALTSRDEKETLQCLRVLKSTHAGTGFMHESFHKNNSSDFTRAWFAWANSLFGELIITLNRENPSLLDQI